MRIYSNMKPSIPFKKYKKNFQGGNQEKPTTPKEKEKEEEKEKEQKTEDNNENATPEAQKEEKDEQTN